MLPSAIAQAGKLLPTLTANSYTGAGSQGRDGGPNLQTAISTCSVEAPHANQLRAPVSAKAQRTTDGSGRKLFARWKLRNRDGSSSRIRLVCSLLTTDWHTKVSWLTWEEKVIGSRVLLCLHQRSGHGTEGIESGLLPTMRANEAQGSAYQYDQGNHDKPRLTLTGLIPTLTTACIEGGQKSRGGARKDELLLNGLIGLIPTTTARDYKSGKGSTQMNRRGPSAANANLSEILEAPGHNIGYKLSSSFAEWHQGYPVGWTDIAENE